MENTENNLSAKDRLYPERSSNLLVRNPKQIGIIDVEETSPQGPVKTEEEKLAEIGERFRNATQEAFREASEESRAY